MSTVTIAPHLWKALEVMGRDMAVEPGALANQAVFAWLRINGYLVGGTAGELRHAAGASPLLEPDSVEPSPGERPTPPSAAPVGVVDLLGSAARHLEGLAGAGAVKTVGEDADEATSAVSGDGPAQADEVDTGESAAPDASRAAAEDAPAEGTFVLRSAPVTLLIEREGHPPVQVEKERFVIGRGPLCDLVIDSPRVSREHVRLTRRGVTFLLEDLGSSNGTWLGEDRITLRELESGDLIVLGNEPVRFTVRADG
jgi:hypothetical protein